MRQEQCVFVADTPALAQAMGNWLEEQGIPVEVKASTTPGGLDGLGSLSGFSQTAMEVWVLDPDQAKEAARLLEEYSQKEEPFHEEDDQPIGVVCERCNETSVFGPESRGKVETCPHCNAFIDVPGGEDWNDLDVGIAEDDLPTEE